MAEPLEYQPQSAHHRYRRSALVCIVIVFAAGGILSQTNWRGGIARCQYLYYQRACAKYAASSDQIVYQELSPTANVKEDKAFVDVKGDRVIGRVARLPACWVWIRDKLGLFSMPPDSERQPLLFLGTLHAQASGDRIVAVFRGWRESGRTFLSDSICACVLPPVGYSGVPTFLATDTPVENARRTPIRTWCQQFTIYAGQADPNDASHFTIRYQADDKSGLIDGWLRADDTLRISVRDGPGFQTLEDAAIERAMKQYEISRQKSRLIE